MDAWKAAAIHNCGGASHFLGACRLSEWAGEYRGPPHPGPLPKGEGEPFGRAGTNPSALDCNQGGKTIPPLPKGPQNAKRSSHLGNLAGGGLGKPLGRGEGEGSNG